MKILMYDHSGSLNHGCEAIVRSTVNIIERVYPGSEYGLLSFSPKEDIILSDISSLKVKGIGARKLGKAEKYINALNVKIFHSYNYYYRTAYSEALAFADNYDLCLIIGGDTFCYGNNELCRKLTAELKKKNKKVVLWGCSVGAEDLTEEKLITLRSLDAIFARESLTQKVLEDAGVENVSLFPDPAFTLIKSKSVPIVTNSNKMLGINLSPLVARRTVNFVKSAVEFLQYIENHTDYLPVLVPHVVEKNNNDHEFLSVVHQASGSEKSILLPDNIGAKDYKAYISECDMFIGARTHSIIGAYSSFVPAFAIGYSIKARGIAKDIFGEELCVRGIDKINCGSDLISCFEELCENKEKMEKILRDRIPQIISSSYAAGAALKNIL